MNSEPNHPDLGALYRHATEVGETVRGWSAKLSLEQTVWQSDPKSWSVAQCIEHLRITTEQYRPGVEALIIRVRTSDAGRRDAAYRPTLVGGFFLKFVQPTYRTKLKAPKAFKPDAAGVPASVLERFADQQDVLLELIRRADECDLNRGKLASPVSPLVRLTLGDALSILVTHQRRHLGQAQRVIDSPVFPG